MEIFLCSILSGKVEITKKKYVKVTKADGKIKTIDFCDATKDPKDPKIVSLTKSQFAKVAKDIIQRLTKEKKK